MKRDPIERAGGNVEATWARRRLKRWLAEWHIDRKLRASDERDAPRPRADAAPSQVGIGTTGSRPEQAAALHRGDIRLLYPNAGTALETGPIYVAVLEMGTNGDALVAPFGRFAEPAVPGEWKTGLSAVPLRVLCLWNARRIPSPRLRNTSWRAGRLTARCRRQALEVHDHFHRGGSLTTVRARSLGPPLRHPLDPRWIYMAEESAALDESPAMRADLYDGTAGDEECATRLLAAEPRPSYNGRKRPRSGKHA